MRMHRILSAVGRSRIQLDRVYDLRDFAEVEVAFAEQDDIAGAITQTERIMAMLRTAHDQVYRWRTSISDRHSSSGSCSPPSGWR